MEFAPIAYVSPWVHEMNPGKAAPPHVPEASVPHRCFISRCTVHAHSYSPYTVFFFERQVSIKVVALLYPLEELAEVSHSLLHTAVGM